MPFSRRIQAIALSFLLVGLAGCEGEREAPGERRCNGHAHLCARRFDEVVYATTHNAMSNEEEGWIGPNQTHTVTRQLEDGVRALMLDTWRWEDEVWLCHGYCAFGNKRYVDGLREIRDFLERAPHEVVSLLIEDYVSDEETASAFELSGLLDVVHTQDPDQPWPTLGEMIDSGRRLVVFSQNRGGTPPWHHPMWRFLWDTHYSAKIPEDFSCAPHRGSRSNSLFLLNHFLTDPIALPELAERVNHDPGLRDRVHECWAANEQMPNLIAVDFYEIGDVLEVTRQLNEALAQ